MKKRIWDMWTKPEGLASAERVIYANNRHDWGIKDGQNWKFNACRPLHEDNHGGTHFFFMSNWQMSQLEENTNDHSIILKIGPDDKSIKIWVYRFMSRTMDLIDPIERLLNNTKFNYKHCIH